MTARRIAVVTAGLSVPSSTRILADRLAAATDRALRLHDDVAEIDVIELRDLAHDLTDNLLTGFPSEALGEAIAKVVGADGVIAVSPIFSASYSGLFKTFFDVLEEDSLAGKPVLIAATAGTARHSLSLEHALRPLFSYLRAVVVPTAVFGASEDFGRIEPTGSSLSQRIERAAGELVDLMGSRPVSRPADPFENPTPFEQLLGN